MEPGTFVCTSRQVVTGSEYILNSSNALPHLKNELKEMSLHLWQLCSLTAMSGEPVAPSWLYRENWKRNPADRERPGEAGT